MEIERNPSSYWNSSNQGFSRTLPILEDLPSSSDSPPSSPLLSQTTLTTTPKSLINALSRPSQVGEVYVYGNGDGGQLGLGEDRKNVEKPVPIKYLKEKRIVQVVAGGMHNLALSETGKVYSWGVNDEGALGRFVPVGEECEVDEIPNSEDFDFVQLEAGDNVSLGLTSQGQIYAWGTFRGDLKGGGELGFSKTQQRQLYPFHLHPKTFFGMTLPSLKKKTKQIVKNELNSTHSKDHTNNALHFHSNHEFHQDTRSTSTLTTRSSLLEKNKKVKRSHPLNHEHSSSFSSHSSSIVPPSLIEKKNEQETMDIDTDVVDSSSSTSFASCSFQKVAAGDNHVLALTKSGHVYAWGNCEHGQTGFLCHHSTNGLMPRKLKFKKGIVIQDIACGSFHSLALDQFGQVWTFGLNNFGQCGVNPSQWHSFYTPYCLPPFPFPAVQLAAGMHHSLILLSSGEVMGMGKNEEGQLGLGQFITSSYVYEPMLNPYLKHIHRIVSGTNHVICIDQEGFGYYFGDNISGQLGISSEDFDCIHEPEQYDFSKSNAKILLAACGAQHTVLLIQK